MLKKLILLIPLLLILPACLGQESQEEISNSEAVSYLHAEVSRSGYIYVFDNSIFQSAKDLMMTLTIPQNTSRQAAFVKSVSGPDRYYIAEDEWGNKVLNLHWEIPELKKRHYYNVVFDVQVFDGDAPAENVKFPATDYTRSNPQITQTAYETAYGLDDIQKIFGLTEWVYKSVKYDNEAKSFMQTAAWTYQQRRGTCDEFSNLLISMLRELGYSPRYVVGFAYSENWGQHGWVEVDYQGKALSLDPTWLESPVDSTHIKVADLPDSNLSEHVEVKGGQITIDWNKGEPEVKVISHKESPKINITAALTPENSSSNSYSLLTTQFTSVPECILTSVNVKSCAMNSMESFLSLNRNKETLTFCGSQKENWFLKAPETESSMVYTCPVIIYGGGAEKTATVTVSANAKKRLSTRMNSQNILTPGQVFQVESVTENSGHSTENATVYVFFQGLSQSKDFSINPGESASIKWTLKAPSKAGNYELIVFSSSGELAMRNMTVIAQRHAEIGNISIPEKAATGEPMTINITVKALSGFTGTLKTASDDYADTKHVSLAPSESKTFWLSYTPKSAGPRTISTTLLSDSQEFEDGWWGSLQVENQKQWWDGILGFLEGIVNSILSALGIR
jgi:hypothetical protein